MITPSFSLTATERILPRMALDFTTASLDSRVTFTRSGNTATVTNSSGFVVPINANLPRFDYDPVTLVCKGLLIEESRVNLLLQSQNINDVIWTKSDATVSNDVVVSPDGTQNADRLVEAATTTSHFVRQNVIGVVGTTYASSIYLKAGERTQAVFIVYDGNTFSGASINLTTGAVTAPPVDAGVIDISASVTAIAVGNGWFYVKNAIIQAVNTTRQIRITIQNGANSVYAGDITKGIYIWGAQIETGAFATSYIPTVASQVTRTADVAVMTGTNFSDWYNASEGAFVASSVLNRQSSTGATAIFSANDNSGLNYINSFYRASGALGANIVAASVLQFDQTPLGVTAANAVVNIGVAYKLNNSVSYANATVQTPDTSVTLPTVTQLQFGIYPGGAYLNGWIKNLRYWNQRILNAEGQAFSK
jgi:hypothetical protein